MILLASNGNVKFKSCKNVHIQIFLEPVSYMTESQGLYIPEV